MIEKFLIVVATLFMLSSFVTAPSAAQAPLHYEIDLRSIGEQIKKARIAKEISQEELADAVGLSTYNIVCIERGKAIPTRSIISKIEMILECEIYIDRIKS